MSLKNLAYRLTPNRLRCRLWGHVAKVVEWRSVELGGTYEMIDNSVCERCGKKFPPVVSVTGYTYGHFKWPSIQYEAGLPERRLNESFAKAHKRGEVDDAIKDWFERPSPTSQEDSR